MTDSMMEVECRKTFGVLDGKESSQVYLKLYVSFFTSGLVAALEPHRTVTLLAIASFMDEQGKCFPTQDQIAQRIGVHRTTASKWVKELLEVRWNGRPIISRVKQRSRGRNANSVYTIYPISQLAIFNGEVEPLVNVTDGTLTEQSYVPGDDIATCQPATLTRTIEQEPYRNISPTESSDGPTTKAVAEEELRNASDVLRYFRQRYRETYNVNYSPNWARDTSLIKNKLMGNYSMPQIRTVIDCVLREYDARWAKPDYPRPTIGQLCTWLPNEALPLIAQGEHQATDLSARIEQVRKEAGHDDPAEALERLRRKLHGWKNP